MPQRWFFLASSLGLTQIRAGQSCSVTPIIDPSAEYPVSSRLWDTVTSVISDYEVKRGLCGQKGNSLTGLLPVIPSITHFNVTMSDGVSLWTTVINPHPFEKRKSAVLSRSPYGQVTSNIADAFIKQNGYVAVLQEDRGTKSSGGVYDLWRGSAQDAAETLDWMVKQNWSNGDVYTVGCSADGISTGTLMMEPPSIVKAQWFWWTTLNVHGFVYPQMAYRSDLIEDYLKKLDGLGYLHGVAPRVIEEVRDHEPWSTWWYNLTACRNVSAPELPQCHYQQAKWPIIMSAGWWDIFQTSMLQDWQGLRQDSDVAVREKHVLIVGPLGHCMIGRPAHHDFTLLSAEMHGIHAGFDLASEFFAGDTNGNTRSKIGRVNFFVMGAFQGAKRGNYWTSLQDWPANVAKPFFLGSSGNLSTVPDSASGSVRYTYDPSDPTPMLGGDNLPGIGNISVCGTADQAPREIRPDVVHFDTDVLQEDMAVVGEIIAHLYVGSSANDTDFFVTLDDVHPPGTFTKGSSFLVRYGAVRMRWRDTDIKQSPHMVAGQVYNVTVRMGYTAYIFEKGHRLRVSVSSAAAGYLNPNSNTGVFEPTHTVTPVLANNTVYFGGDVASAVVLPVVRFEDIPENPNFTKASSDIASDDTLQYV